MKLAKTRTNKTAETDLTAANASSGVELALLLRGVRISSGLSVQELARAAGMTVRRTAFIERGGDAFLSEIQSYVAALGFELRLEFRPKKRPRKSQ